MGVDLVLVSLGGVQRFISESRTTADVAGGSEVIQRLVRHAADVAARELASALGPCGLIFPTTGAGDTSGGVTNKVAFLAPEGSGPRIAREVAQAVDRLWRQWVEQAFAPHTPANTPAMAPQTPGVPDIAWVSVTGSAAAEDYPKLWEAAQRAMTSRRRARVFEPLVVSRSALCAQSPSLPASQVPAQARRHEKRKREELSAAGWVKRDVARQYRPSFPSTPAVASSFFCAAVRETTAIHAALRDPVRRLAEAAAAAEERGPVRAEDVSRALDHWLGAWVYPESWDRDGLAHEFGRTAATFEDVARAGRDAARRIITIASEAGIRGPRPYYAIIVQDLDRLGRTLGTLDLAAHREASQQLTTLAAAQLERARRYHAVAVYAGGDDFLAFCPAPTALRCAEAMRTLVDEQLRDGPLATVGPNETPATASTAVVFAHMTSPLREAIAAAHSALEAAKDAEGPGRATRDALAVVIRRRGGERARTIQPWRPGGNGETAVDLLERVRPKHEQGQLSAGLAARLEQDATPLTELAAHSRATAHSRPTLAAELARLVDRHGGTPQAAQALNVLGQQERSTAGRIFQPVPSVLVARFLHQECQ